LAFKPHPQCKVCQTIQAEKGRKLLTRIYGSRPFDSRGESLSAIADDYKGDFAYVNLLNHVKRHQALTDRQLANRRIESLSREIEAEKIRQHFSHNDLRQLVMDKGYEDIKEGKVKLTATSIMTAAKQASDIEEKNKDRQIEVMKMMAAFQSGELIREEIDGPVTAKSEQRIAAETSVGSDSGA
jgi:hypothetical protein